MTRRSGRDRRPGGFVVAVAVLGIRLIADTSWTGLASYLGYFVALWWLWASFTFYADRYDTDEAFRVMLPIVKQARDAGCETIAECTRGTTRDAINDTARAGTTGREAAWRVVDVTSATKLTLETSWAGLSIDPATAYGGRSRRVGEGSAAGPLEFDRFLNERWGAGRLGRLVDCRFRNPGAGTDADGGNGQPLGDGVGHRGWNGLQHHGEAAGLLQRQRDEIFELLCTQRLAF